MATAKKTPKKKIAASKKTVNIFQRVEAFRTSNNITLSDMDKLFGIGKAYWGWKQKKSIPEKHHKKAMSVASMSKEEIELKLSGEKPNRKKSGPPKKQKPSGINIDAFSFLSQDEKHDLVIAWLPDMNIDTRSEVLQFLVRR